VRAHTGPRAAAAARAAGAAAFTVGDDIVFGAGRYAPGTLAGQRLIVHELAHVRQQRRGVGRPPQLQALEPGSDDPFEREADAAAETVLARGATRTAAACDRRILAHGSCQHLACNSVW
jgi:hypothetical protein